MPARRFPSWVWVTGLTAGAVAVVVVMGVQADDGQQPGTAARPSGSASPQPSASESESSAAVPDDSGTGRRIVYSLGQKRVWLVDASDATRRSFAVWPGTVSPDTGTYTISQRTEATTGSDGVAIEHIMYFASESGLSIAFSNAVDGSSPPPASGVRTSGIRSGKADGTALWVFGETGTTVAVVE